MAVSPQNREAWGREGGKGLGQNMLTGYWDRRVCALG